MSSLKPIKMIIDTDPGIDDAMAILYAASDPRIALLGLTTVFGNVSIEVATRNALRLAEMAKLDLPVASGAGKPLSLPPFPPSSQVHGIEGFGDIPAKTPLHQATSEPAAQFLVRMAELHKGELVICAIGPITNIAAAIQLDPNFAGNVRQIVFMGGAAFTAGNITPFAEANTYHDPHALNIVIGSGADIIMVGLDVTHQLSCRDEDFAEIESRAPSFGSFLRQASRYYIDYHKQRSNMAACYLHDPLAIMVCTDPDLFKRRDILLKVLEEGPQSGRTLPLEDEIDKLAGAGQISVCVDLDAEKAKAQFISMFCEK